MKSWKCLAAAVALLALAACEEDPETVITTRNLDRPVDVAFGCAYVESERNPDGTRRPNPRREVRPLAECLAQRATEYAPPPVPPRGLTPPAPRPEDPAQQPPDPSLAFFAFALESEPGSVAITKLLAINETWPPQSGVAALEPYDADVFAPGLNGVSIGTNPVAITGDRSGCFVITANGGSNDLSVLGVAAAVDRQPGQKVKRVAITGGGAPFTARPAAMVGEEPSTTTTACPSTAEGKLYIAYPTCQAVAVVSAATGAIESHVSFASGGPVIGAGAPACAADPALYRPSTLDLVRDPSAPAGERSLAIGAENSASVTVVKLDAAGLPLDAGKVTVTLEGDIGVIDVALTNTLAMGGADGEPNDEDDVGGLHQFVYAVADDATVRVASVTAGHECETQVDVRYLGDVTDISQLSCLTPGDPSRPRRPGSRGRPGLTLVNDVAPTAVTIASSKLGRIFANNDGTQAITLYPGPGSPVDSTWDVPVAAGLTERRILTGTFAYVASTNGDTYIVNVDDDAYPDLESSDPTKPLDVELSQALPHQLRDNVASRNARPQAKLAMGDTTMDSCTQGSDSLPADTGGVRLEKGFTFTGLTALIAGINLDLGPDFRGVVCEGHKANEQSNGFVEERVAVSEMSMHADPVERAKHFPDIRELPSSTTWRFVWEGQLFDEQRRALVPVDGTGMRLYDPAEPFCSMGAEVFDSVTLVGCDPTRGNADCGLGETCYVDPQAPSAQGACLPTKDLGILAGPCHDFLISNRRYTVTSTRSGELRLGERRQALASSPITGCESDAQCEQLAGFELAKREGTPLTPADLTGDLWRCEADPTRPPIPGNNRRCVRHCSAEVPCTGGNVCVGLSETVTEGVCVEGVVPRLQCVRGLQRYQLRSTDAFTVTSIPLNQPAVHQHKIVERPDGTCGVDPANDDPYLVGRVRLNPPACEAAGDPAIVNPCSTTVDHAALRYDRTTTCTEPPTLVGVEERGVPAVRFRNGALDINLVDLTYPGDATCRGDRAGTLVGVPLVVRDFLMSFRTISGFTRSLVPVSFAVVFPVNVVRAPDNTIWVVDEGRLQTDIDRWRGRLHRFNPATGATLVVE